MKIELTIRELETMLEEQKRVVGEYITRNLSTFTFYNENSDQKSKKPIDIDLTKTELKKECFKAGFPSDFSVLKKYIK